MKPSPDHSDTLHRLGIIPLPQHIMDMPLKEIRKHFGYATTRGIKKSLLMRNLLWQIYSQIQAGQPPDFVKKHGFIRGLWYYIKKKFSKHHALRGDWYNLMSQELTRMIKAGLFTYSDFNFRDRDESSWKLGFDNPHIILLAEKDGFITIMEDLQKQYGCHTITAGGIPSLMTVSYMVKSMQHFGIDLTQPFYVLSFCDFDPSGYNVAEEFIHHLEHSGIQNAHVFDQWGQGKSKRPWLELATPQNFQRPPKDHWYKLPKQTWDDPSTQAWVKLTGGLDPKWKKGQLTHGLESDEFDFDEILALYETKLAPLLKAPSDTIKQRNAFQTLRQELENMAITKFLKRLKDGAQIASEINFQSTRNSPPVQLSRELYQALKTHAQSENISLETLINLWLQKQLYHKV